MLLNLFKWVGSTCADRPKLTTESGEHEHEGWQERAFEQRAQKLASQLAEQLFQERAEQVTQRAKDIIMSGPPPCNCTPQGKLIFLNIPSQNAIRKKS